MTDTVHSMHKRNADKLLWHCITAWESPEICLVLVEHAGISLQSGVIKKVYFLQTATGNHLMKSTSLEKLGALTLVSATLEIEHAF